MEPNANAKKKKNRPVLRLVILCLAAVLLAVAYGLLSSANRKKAEAERLAAQEAANASSVAVADFDPAEYVRKVFGMYPDNLCTVELLCDNEVMRSVIDHFGENVQTETVDEQHFRATVEVASSPPFFSWVFTFSGKIRIVSPAAVLEEMRDMAAWLK